MPKSKKPASTDAADEKPATPAKKKAPAKKAAKPAAKAGASTGGSPLIDTNLAAASAAKMLLARAAGGASAGGATSTGSSDFQQLKQSVAKPQGALDNLLHTTAPKNVTKTNVPFHQQKQVGHNQTYGADVNRTGVPRRTSGG